MSKKLFNSDRNQDFTVQRNCSNFEKILSQGLSPSNVLKPSKVFKKDHDHFVEQDGRVDKKGMNLPGASDKRSSSLPYIHLWLVRTQARGCNIRVIVIGLKIKKPGINRTSTLEVTQHTKLGKHKTSTLDVTNHNSWRMIRPNTIGV